MFRPFFSRIIVFDKPRRTLYTGPKGFPTLTVEVIRSFLQDLRGCYKQNFFGKKAISPVEKRFWPSSLRIIEDTKPHGTFY